LRYVIGVDGGGTKTYTVITDQDGNKISEGHAKGSNHQTVGIDTAKIRIQESIESALELAGLDYRDIAFVQYGLAGADREKDFSILRPALSTIPFQHWDLVCDAFEGLRIGSPQNIGVALICGTGTNAIGLNSKGQVIQTGGFGHLYGDAAGGRHMARETFRAAVRSWDGRESPSVLVTKVAEFFGHNSMDELYNDFLDRDVTDVPGELTTVLHRASEEGDRLAIRILKQTGCELGIAANSVIRRLGGFAEDTVPVVLIGSVFQKGKNVFLLESLSETVAKETPNAQIIVPDLEPVYGAVLLAMDRLGIATSASIYDKFKSYGGLTNDKKQR
jgi:N-acetylglucosamine kinase-like BadF-type ATPase